MKKLFFALLLFASITSQAQMRVETDLWVKNKLKMIGATVTAISTDSTTHYGSGTKLITERAAKAYARLAAITFGGGGGGITDGPKGDIDVSGFGANWKLNDTIVTDNLTGLGQSFQVFRPAGQSYLSATLSPYGVNVFGDSFKKTLIQDGQINLQNSNPFINIKTQTSGVALGIDTIVKHYYIDMIDNLQFSIEQQSIPFLHFTGRNSALYPAPYRGILYLANANTDNVVIGDVNAGDLGASQAHKDAKLTVFGNTKIFDTLKLRGKFFANSLPVAKRSKQLYWNPIDSTISTGDTTGIGAGSSALNNLSAATGNNTISNGQYTQKWQWSGTGFQTFDNYGLGLFSNHTGAVGNGNFNLWAETEGAEFASNGTGGAANFIAKRTGTDNRNIGIRAEAYNGARNMAIYVPAGTVSIGAVSPPSATQNVSLYLATPFNGTPLRFLDGSLISTPLDGSVEYNGTSLYWTAGGIRSKLTTLKDVGQTMRDSGQTILTRPGIHKQFSITADTLTLWVDTTSASNVQTASYTLAMADQYNTWVITNVGSANNVTVPPNSTVAFPIGTEIPIEQRGAGQTTIVAGAGVTINSAGAKLKITGQYSTALLRKTATDTWLLLGDISN